MISDKLLQAAFLISLAAHSAILSQASGISPLSNSKRKIKESFDIKYIKPSEEIKRGPKRLKAQKEPLLKIQKISLAKAIPKSIPNEESSVFKKNRQIVLTAPSFQKPAFIKPDIIAVKKRIILSMPEEANRPSNTAYISHSQVVREKIKRSLYQNYSGAETGQVYMSFVVTSGGMLKDAHIAEEKSSSNPRLKEIALKSIQDASPFPGFPKDLDYPELSFNVVVSFQIE